MCVGSKKRHTLICTHIHTERQTETGAFSDWGTLLFQECADENSTSVLTLKHWAVLPSEYMRTQKDHKTNYWTCRLQVKLLPFLPLYFHEQPFIVYVDRILKSLVREDEKKGTFITPSPSQNLFSFLCGPPLLWMTSKWTSSHLSFGQDIILSRHI